jgi:enamine deaminase RidA (YjgF/YER057c/UK114 family)
VAVQLIRSAELYGGVPYAYASVAPPGTLVFAAGACPLDQGGSVVGEGDIEAQARQVMANLVVALQAAGAGLSDVLKTTVYVASADRADLVAAWDVIRAAFGEHDAPSTLLGVTVLGYPGQLVEIEAIAAGASSRSLTQPRGYKTVQAARRCSSQIVAPSAAAVRTTKMPASMPCITQNRSAGW